MFRALRSTESTPPPAGLKKHPALQRAIAGASQRCETNPGVQTNIAPFAWPRARYNVRHSSFGLRLPRLLSFACAHGARLRHATRLRTAEPQPKPHDGGGPAREDLRVLPAFGACVCTLLGPAGCRRWSGLRPRVCAKTHTRESRSSQHSRWRPYIPRRMHRIFRPPKLSGAGPA